MGLHKDLVNVIILIVKQYVYANKYFKTPVTFIGAMTKIIDYYKIEKVIAYRNNKQGKFYKNGSPLLIYKFVFCITTHIYI